LIALALWETGRGIAKSIRERRKLSKRKSYSLALDVALLLLAALITIGTMLGCILALDYFGLAEKPLIWLAAIPILLVYWLANHFRRKLERRWRDRAVEAERDRPAGQGRGSRQQSSLVLLGTKASICDSTL
jgi:hypothetical protein